MARIEEFYEQAGVIHNEYNCLVCEGIDQLCQQRRGYVGKLEGVVINEIIYVHPSWEGMND